MVFTESNNLLIRFITIKSIITTPAILAIVAISSFPLVVRTLSNITSTIPALPILNNKLMSSMSSPPLY